MNTIELKRKGPDAAPGIVIYDDLIMGVLSPGPYVIGLFAGLWPLERIIDEYRFPLKHGEPMPRIASFMKGHNPTLFKKIEFYGIAVFPEPDILT